MTKKNTMSKGLWERLHEPIKSIKVGHEEVKQTDEKNQKRFDKAIDNLIESKGWK